MSGLWAYLSHLSMLDNFTAGYFESSPEFDIRGDAVIYASQGTEILPGAFSLEDFRTFRQTFMLITMIPGTPAEWTTNGIIAET